MASTLQEASTLLLQFLKYLDCRVDTSNFTLFQFLARVFEREQQLQSPPRRSALDRYLQLDVSPIVVRARDNPSDTQLQEARRRLDESLRYDGDLQAYQFLQLLTQRCTTHEEQGAAITVFPLAAHSPGFEGSYPGPH